MKKQITVYGVVYNNYGGFIPQWIKYMKKQTLKPEVVIALGKDHGADLEWLDKNKIKYVLCDSDNMGQLRNAALEKVTTPFHLYFSIDDELLPEACEFIVNQDADALSIRYDVIEPDGRVRENWPSPKMNTLEDLYNWEKMWGGYVAVKGNHDIRYREDIAVPNLSFHFELFKRGITTVDSNKVLIIHHRRLGSHHFKSVSEGITKQFIVEINKTREEVIRNLLKTGRITPEEFDDFKEHNTLICIKRYKDYYLKEKVVKKKDNISEIYRKNGKLLTKERANLLIAKGKAKRV